MMSASNDVVDSATSSELDPLAQPPSTATDTVINGSSTPVSPRKTARRVKQTTQHQQQTQLQQQQQDNSKTRRTFALFGSHHFHIPRSRIDKYFTPGRRLDAWCGLIHWGVEYFVYLLGPMLICLASSIICLLMYTYFWIMYPMQQEYYKDSWYGAWIIRGHIIWVVFLFTNIVQNYFKCVTTNNIKGPSYDKVMREMAQATGLEFPETPEQVNNYRRDYQDRMVLRMQCRQQRAQDQRQAALAEMNVSANGETDEATQRKPANSNQVPVVEAISVKPQAPVRQWMLLGPLEWGFCNRTNQPKPPRSHFCHVSKGLVMCLDHYCPWMFNSVGYFNYRYFVNFLLFTVVSMAYSVFLTLKPFLLLSTPQYREQIRANKHHHLVSNSEIPLARLEPYLPRAHERMAITLTFMLCLAVGLAVLMLCIFHLYLTLTAQTTIEFHGNYMSYRQAKKAGKKWKNPYDFGPKRNFQQVYGASLPPLLAIIIPSSREPEFLPVPLHGEQGLRSTYASLKPTTGPNYWQSREIDV